jgi:hypothetical protein
VDLRRPRLGDWIAGVSGAVLVGALFLDWYRVDSLEIEQRSGAARGPVEIPDGTVTAWQAFSVVDVLLLVVGLAAVAVVVVAATQRTPAVPIAVDSLVALLALIGLVVVLTRVASVPEESLIDDLPAGVTVTDMDVTRLFGAWLGLAATAGALAGALVAMRDEGLGRSAGRWRPGEESPVSVTTLPPPQPRSETPEG